MTEPTPPRTRRNPAPIILVVVALLLVVYYAVVALSGVLQTSTEVAVRDDNTLSSDDYLTLRMSTQDVDLTNRVIQANVLPIPHGELEGAEPGEIAANLRIEVRSGGVTTSVVAVPGESIVDPTSLTLALERGDSDYPFDKPFADFQLAVENTDTDRPVAFELELSNSARPWMLTAARGEANQDNESLLYPIQIHGSRDVLTITLVMFYVLAILLTTLMAVVTIGSAILRRQLEFSNVIWLSATLLSFPALRSAMPGAPPIGTALDFLVLFPCLCLIAGMLLWTGGHLLWRESHVLRRRILDDDEVAPDRAAALP
ncbi:DUF4436 domain-containing protein [Labedella populi]|uniref:DUF4436 domain-containing protein n=1 Tax=Labedella populi TaxID=2498850 RepID=A0A3S3ZWB8_9MICO|nr:DUF4436 family protein [Labedella populi]RWZ68033.1 DUF4436 domain-containing protein [Labedella populi]